MDERKSRTEREKKEGKTEKTDSFWIFNAPSTTQGQVGTSENRSAGKREIIKQNETKNRREEGSNGKVVVVVVVVVVWLFCLCCCCCCYCCVLCVFFNSLLI